MYLRCTVARSCSCAVVAKKRFDIYFFLIIVIFSTRTVGEEISHDTFVVGSLERVWGTSSLLSENESEVVGAVLKMWVFKRAIVSGVEYQSVLYKRITSRNNCTVIFQRHGKYHYGSIEKFVKCVEKCTGMQCLYEKCSCSLSVRYIAVAPVPVSNLSWDASSKAHITGDHYRPCPGCTNFLYKGEMYED